MGARGTSTFKVEGHKQFSIEGELIEVAKDGTVELSESEAATLRGMNIKLEPVPEGGKKKKPKE